MGTTKIRMDGGTPPDPVVVKGVQFGSLSNVSLQHQMRRQRLAMPRGKNYMKVSSLSS